MATNTRNGKAFEYACVKAFEERYQGNQEIELVDSPQMRTARAFYEELPNDIRNNLSLAAKAAARVIEKLEPQLQVEQDNKPLFLALQTDAQGQAGDVRDVLCIRKQNGWEIGISCKHNHHAVKHSRLSGTIDFGKEWFGKECSNTYWQTIRPKFSKLKELRDDSKALGEPMRWDEVEDKFGEYYIPILQAFMDELERLDKEYPKEIPAALIRYLIGKYDFYKVITDDAHRTTRVEAINLWGTLNQKAGNLETIVKVQELKLPSRFYHIGFKETDNGPSSTTIEVVCDEGWTVSMRLHSASSKIEPSLKFDVNLISLPGSIHAQVEPWSARYERYVDEQLLIVADNDMIK